MNVITVNDYFIKPLNHWKVKKQYQLTEAEKELANSLCKSIISSTIFCHECHEDIRVVANAGQPLWLEKPVFGNWFLFWQNLVMKDLSQFPYFEFDMGSNGKTWSIEASIGMDENNHSLISWEYNMETKEWNQFKDKTVNY
jgi:hypothetical protein